MKRNGLSRLSTGSSICENLSFLFPPKRIMNRSASLLLLAAIGAAFTTQVRGQAIELNRIRAVVNGEPITQTMVDSAVQTQVQIWLMGNNGMISSKDAAAREIRRIEENALEELIDRNLILSEFKKLGGQIKDQFVDESVTRFINERFKGDKAKFHEELKKSGMTISQFREIQRDQIAIQALRSKHGGDEVIPNTPWEKRQKYDEIKGKFASEGTPKVRLMSIAKQTPTSNPQQQAEILKEVMSKLNSGADFADLARKYSADSRASEGGYVGVLDKDTLNEGLTRVAYSLRTGQVSQPLDDGPYWRIMKVEDRVGQKTPSLDDIEEEVDRALTAEKRNKALETWLKKLRRDANVRVY